MLIGVERNRGYDMLSEEARIGTRVKVGEGHRTPDRRGQEGTIANRWGDPNYAALDVLLDDGDRQLFWHHEVEELGGGEGGL